MKPLDSFAPIYASLWQAAITLEIEPAPADDPCSMQGVGRILFPSRAASERARYQLTHYRAAVRKHAQAKHLSNDERQKHARFAGQMDGFTLRWRNLAHPSVTSVGRAFHDLPDGPHALYFWEKYEDDRNLERFIKTKPRPDATPERIAPSPQDQVLRDIGFGTDREAEPITDEAFFEEEPKV